ncbi:small ribosomal subunit protein mS38 isoform X2 [Phascolarctos cinereus]|uniref:Small ribosomal subunit protein mS38 n=1 Tax=Phascolarctos cinereus TaxID=38626 RepID=A0A6P5JCJ3_PHACI|nr:aurora kinase A-interacting protein [Phascolarctos cinereus]XP_020831982.1 aurora kinase A-interacting protein [Phascolarctos cinereus]XP_020831988.1 aurora kinase A-interacting protein [Phascolarctos cinereus]
MFLARVTSQLTRALPWAGRCVLRPGPPVPPPVCMAKHCWYSTWPAGRNGPASQPQAQRDPELEEMLVPRKLSISPLESWLTVQYLLPKPEVTIPGPRPGTGSLALLYDCPPSEAQDGEELGEGGSRGAPAVHCKNMLKIRRRKMNHHKYRKLVKRTRFLRRKVLDGRKKRKQIRFEKDLKRVWKKAGLKQAPEGWQPPKIYVKST